MRILNKPKNFFETKVLKCESCLCSLEITEECVYNKWIKNYDEYESDPNKMFFECSYCEKENDIGYCHHNDCFPIKKLITQKPVVVKYNPTFHFNKCYSCKIVYKYNPNHIYKDCAPCDFCHNSNKVKQHNNNQVLFCDHKITIYIPENKNIEDKMCKMCFCKLQIEGQDVYRKCKNNCKHICSDCKGLYRRTVNDIYFVCINCNEENSTPYVDEKYNYKTKEMKNMDNSIFEIRFIPGIGNEFIKAKNEFKKLK